VLALWKISVYDPKEAYPRLLATQFLGSKFALGGELIPD
jgi:hypothetical protein